MARSQLTLTKTNIWLNMNHIYIYIYIYINNHVNLNINKYMVKHNEFRSDYYVINNFNSDLIIV